MKLYQDWDEDLLRRRSRASEIVAEYNASYGRELEERSDILRRLFKHLGRGVHFEQTLRCEFGDGISVGDGVIVGPDCILYDGGSITIGNNCLIGPRVGIYTSNHATDAAERVAGGCWDLPVRIGDRVWLGGGVTVNPGSVIGSDTIIASGSVVRGRIPSGVIASGCPAMVVREITEADKTGFSG
jgi:maltose O-acetyltransferase